LIVQPNNNGSDTIVIEGCLSSLLRGDLLPPLKKSLNFIEAPENCDFRNEEGEKIRTELKILP
jgi:hypothetical protein